MYKIDAIVSLIDGEVIHLGSSDITAINGFSPLNEAVEGDLSFYGNPKYFNDFAETSASAVIVQDVDNLPESYTGILFKVENVYAAVAKILSSLDKGPEVRKGRGSNAIVSDKATLHENCYVGDSSVISPEANIGDGTQIMENVYIGPKVKIGTHCIIYPGVRILHGTSIGDHCVIQSNTVIGSEGFGYTPTADGTLKKIPQLGNVIIEDAVEIGSNCSIDRGSIKDTVIKSGVKLDNLIQIAHNVEIGSNTVIAALTGIAGSAKIGSNCMIGGQVGIVGHITVADNTQIQAQSGLSKAVKTPGTAWYGSPAIDYKNYVRSYAAFKNLPELLNRVKTLEKELQRLNESE